MVVHGGITSSSREVMRPIVNRFKGLLFYNSLYEGGVCDRRHVSTGMVPAQQLEPLFDYVVNELGGKRTYILAADYNYGHITSKWMQKFTRDRGGEDLAVEFFPLDVNNFQPAISRIQAAKPDVVMSALVGGAHIAFYRQFEASIGKDKMMLASSTYGVGLEHTQLSPEEGNGIILATSFVDDLDTAEAKDFVSRFHAYTGDTGYVGEYGEYGERGVKVWAEQRASGRRCQPRRRDRGTCFGQRQRGRRGRPIHGRRADQPHDHGHPHRPRQHDPDFRRDQLVLAAPAAGYAAGLRSPCEPDDKTQYEVEVE